MLSGTAVADADDVRRGATDLSALHTEELSPRGIGILSCVLGEVR
jgi:hypothetical protein